MNFVLFNFYKSFYFPSNKQLNLSRAKVQYLFSWLNVAFFWEAKVSPELILLSCSSAGKTELQAASVLRQVLLWKIFTKKSRCASPTGSARRWKWRWWKLLLPLIFAKGFSPADSVCPCGVCFKGGRSFPFFLPICRKILFCFTCSEAVVPKIYQFFLDQDNFEYSFCNFLWSKDLMTFWRIFCIIFDKPCKLTDWVILSIILRRCHRHFCVKGMKS